MGYKANDEGKKYGCFTVGVIMGAQKKWKSEQREGLM